jgi:hypothetical protein
MSDEESDEEGEGESMNLTSFLFGNIRRYRILILVRMPTVNIVASFLCGSGSGCCSSKSEVRMRRTGNKLGKGESRYRYFLDLLFSNLHRCKCPCGINT